MKKIFGTALAALVFAAAFKHYDKLEEKVINFVNKEKEKFSKKDEK